MVVKGRFFRNKAYRDQRAELRNHTQQWTTAAQPTSIVTTPEMPSVATFYQLSTLKIRPFKGDRRDWPAFEEAFKNAIDQKPGSKIKKFNVLRTLLQGETETLITRLRLDEANYEVAKKMLKDTYGDGGSYLRILYTDLADLKRCQTLEDATLFNGIGAIGSRNGKHQRKY